MSDSIIILSHVPKIQAAGPPFSLKRGQWGGGKYVPLFALDVYFPILFCSSNRKLWLFMKPDCDEPHKRILCLAYRISYILTSMFNLQNICSQLSIIRKLLFLGSGPSDALNYFQCNENTPWRKTAIQVDVEWKAVMRIPLIHISLRFQGHELTSQTCSDEFCKCHFHLFSIHTQ